MSHEKQPLLKFFRDCQWHSGLSPFVQVLIGRSNKENDTLSHKVAAKTDFWFHARGFPGSHTVLRVPSGRCASPSTAHERALLQLCDVKSKENGGWVLVLPGAGDASNGFYQCTARPRESMACVCTPSTHPR